MWRADVYLKPLGAFAYGAGIVFRTAGFQAIPDTLHIGAESISLK